MNATLWNYSAGNEHAHGDGWNGEDLSVFCREELQPPSEKAPAASSGGRALRGFIRPYAIATAGKPLQMSFNRKSGKFRYSFEADFSIQAPTEIFVPIIQYPDGYTVTARGCNQITPKNAGSTVFSRWFILSFIPSSGTPVSEIIITRRS
jgi:hypothetical protein